MSLGKISLSGVPVQLDIVLGPEENSLSRPDNPVRSFSEGKDFKEAGDTPETATKIEANPPFAVFGKLKKEDGDTDCYSFQAKANKFYVIGVTGSNRLLKVNDEVTRDGFLDFSSGLDRLVKICISGKEQPRGYLLTVFERKI